MNDDRSAGMTEVIRAYRRTITALLDEGEILGHQEVILLAEWEMRRRRGWAALLAYWRGAKVIRAHARILRRVKRLQGEHDALLRALEGGSAP